MLKSRRLLICRYWTSSRHISRGDFHSNTPVVISIDSQRRRTPGISKLQQHSWLSILLISTVDKSSVWSSQRNAKPSRARRNLRSHDDANAANEPFFLPQYRCLSRATQSSCVKGGPCDCETVVVMLLSVNRAASFTKAEHGLYMHLTETEDAIKSKLSGYFESLEPIGTSWLADTLDRSNPQSRFALQWPSVFHTVSLLVAFVHLPVYYCHPNAPD